MPLAANFFNRNATTLAQDLLGKVIRHRHNGHWLSARIIETECYFMHEKGSHSSLGFSEKRKALFMPAATIYMYYAHGNDSFNVSAKGRGNAVLIKAAHFYQDELSDKHALRLMQKLNPLPSGELRKPEKLCAGQTLLCRALHLKVPEWDQQQFDANRFFIDDIKYQPNKIIQTTRLGIPIGRDEHLHYRFVDFDYAKYCTSNPLTKRGWIEGTHYTIK